MKVGLSLVLGGLLLAGCATSYQSSSFTGGYSDVRVDDSHYRVIFAGNGLASEARIWNFWFYRCAELTLQKGYAYYAIEVPPPPPQVPLVAPTKPSAYHPADGVRMSDGVYRPQSELPLVKTAHSGATTTTIVTTGAVAKYSSNAVVAMYHDAYPVGVRAVVDAAAVVRELGPFVRADGNIPPPGRAEMVARVTVGVDTDIGKAAELIDPAVLDYANLPRYLPQIALGQTEPLAPWVALNSHQMLKTDTVRIDGEPFAKFVLFEIDFAPGGSSVSYRLSRYRVDCVRMAHRSVAEITLDGFDKSPVTARIATDSDMIAPTENDPLNAAMRNVCRRVSLS